MNTTILPIKEIESEPVEQSLELGCSTPIQMPAKIRRDIPLSAGARELVARTRQEIASIIAGHDTERLVVVCGPCSIDDVNSALVYAERLRRLAEEVEDRVLLVMRAYFEKPRSVVGWKGMLYDPLNSSESSPTAGISIARRFVARVNDSGLPCATEFLNPLLALYLEDCMAYGSIGSRTVESQIHRELASRLPLPVGMKNAMDGGLASSINAVQSAQACHSFFGQNLSGEACMIETRGNPAAHIVLRGGSNGPNYDEDSVAKAVSEGRKLGLERPVVVDCSHGNSCKDHRRQAAVVDEILRQRALGQSGIAGVMLESNLVEGRQDIDRGNTRRFGQSITDACIGWKDTEYLVRKLASADFRARE